MNKNQPPYYWYDLTQGDTSYTYAVCRWGAGLAAATKALAALFERMAEYQLDATRDMARLTRDPSRAMESYNSYAGRMMQMQAELQGSVEKLTRDADLMYENLRREIDGDAAAPPNAPSPDVRPTMRYGQPASEGMRGPGDWRFDPNQGLPPSESPTAITKPPPYAPPSTNMSAPAAEAYPPAPAPLAAQPQPSMPRSAYPVASAAPSEAGAVQYGRDGYRRVARAKP